jgi:hypothetical protein
MSRRFITRLGPAFIVVLSLLFSQLALANYVCPAESDPAAMATMMASGQPCRDMDGAQPALCHEHGAGSPQSFEPMKTPAATSPMLVQVLELPFVPELDEAVAAPGHDARDTRPPPEPLFLSTLRLRV